MSSTTNHFLVAFTVALPLAPLAARVPGRKARYLRRETKPARAEYFQCHEVEMWGKE
jgi:hypothetical protein